MKFANCLLVLLLASAPFGCRDGSAPARLDADAAKVELAKVKSEAEAAKTEVAQLKKQLADQAAKQDHCKTSGADLIVTRIVKNQRVSSRLDETVGAQIKKLPGVRRVEGALVDVMMFDEIPIVYFFGLDPTSMYLGEFDLKQGRKLTQDDRRKVAIGSMLARSLDKKLSDRIEFLGEQFEVIAIYESYNLLENNGAVIPLREMQEILNLEKKVSTFQIWLEESHRHADKVEELRNQIEALRSPSGQSYNIGVQATHDFCKKAK